jgi:type IX secretion system PorP/SprF family membrane protein
MWVFLLLLTAVGSNGQDIHFSQFFETPLLRNPGLAGIFSGDVRVQAVYRTQWNKVTVPYQTGSFNGEYRLPIGRGDDFLTLGGQILYDKAGTVALTATHVLPTVNYHKSLSSERNMYLSLGFMGGIVQRKFDRSKMTTNNQWNGNTWDPGASDGEMFGNNGYTYVDGAVGASFNSQVGSNEDNNVFVGLAYHHFNKASKISFNGDADKAMMPKYVMSAGFRMSVSEYAYATFHGDYSIQGPHTEGIIGALYTFKLDDPIEPQYLFHAGAFIRLKDAFIPVLKMEKKPFAVAVSYDANLSQLKTASRGQGGFELSLSYQIYLNRERSILCPKF